MRAGRPKGGRAPNSGDTCDAERKCACRRPISPSDEMVGQASTGSVAQLDGRTVDHGLAFLGTGWGWPAATCRRVIFVLSVSRRAAIIA